MNNFFAKLVRKAGFIENINTKVKRKINDVEFEIPLVHGFGLDNLNITEIWMCDLLKKIIGLKNGSFIDVGVNVGQTLLKLRSVDKMMDYIGFEPNPKCIFYTNILIKENKFENCRLVPVGLFNKDSILHLNLYSEEDTDSSASVIHNFRFDQKIFNKVFVPVSRFETVNEILAIKDIAIIKIDVEGAELEVLESMQENISVFKPIIIMELLPCYRPENTDRVMRQAKIEAIFKEINYKIIRIIRNRENRIEKLQPLDTIEMHGDLDLCDYLIVPHELVSKVAIP